MNVSQSISATVTSLSFSFLTTEDIRRISVKQITNPVLLDDLNRPNIGGLYDPALGPSDKKDLCATCHLSYFTCPGHYGHIELPSPVFHPLFMVQMLNILRGTCLYCHRFKVPRTVLARYMAKLTLLERGLLEAANGLDSLHPVPKRTQEDEDEKFTSTEDTEEDFHKRIQIYVAANLVRAPQSRRDHYKDGLVYQERKAVILEFIKATLLKKCQNEDCNAHAHSLRKDGHTKVVELDLSPKQRAIHKAANIRRPDVLREDRAARLGQPRDDNAMDVDERTDSDTEVSDDNGEPTFSGDAKEEEEEEHDPSHKNIRLAKSVSGRVKGVRGRNERVMPPEECRAHLRRLFINEEVMCSLLFGRHGPLAPVTNRGYSKASADMFFLDCLLVSPTRFRPPASVGDSLFEHSQNELLAKVLNTSYLLRDLNNELRQLTDKDSGANDATVNKVTGRLLDALVQLQVDVNSFMDSSKNPTRVRQGKLPPAGVKQGLEKKEGLFRMHMMGKRVNYAARSVISPDVNIETNEIGIPPVFAMKLTFPEPVNDHNILRMKELVERGPNVHPGAVMVEFEDGTKLMLDKQTEEQRKALAKQLLTPQNRELTQNGMKTKTLSLFKKVFRHVQDGDNLILNRQPTLHKPSMMVHKARILHGEKTIRMHYANCNSYNADFDGDEMNIHFPQNHLAQAEAQFIANTDNQYLVPTSGKPLRGLIQDHVVAGVWMTNRETFFSREEYFQLLYGALRPEEDNLHTGRLLTLPPTIWKPIPLWSGKQIISTILLNITPRNAGSLNLKSKAKVNSKLWGKNSEEGDVLFMDGELLCGVLDKSQFGATDYGLVHSVYELYGPEIAGKLLSILSRLFTKYLQHRAFTCRMDDLILTKEGNAKRKEILLRNKNLGTEGAMENFPSLADTPAKDKVDALRRFLQDVLRDDSKMAGLDMTVKKKLAGLTKSIADACMPHELSRQFPHNHMQMMTQSGAKGSAVNAQQISCALGQQELEGRRVPVMVSGKTLPSFKAFETDAIAGGYVASRFLTGVKPQEFYFHCMAGREGLIDTAVKTSRSGYLQRCLIKHLEGIRVHYDNTVRGGDNSIYQFNYGGDSLDVTKQMHLYQFEFSIRNYSSLVHRYSPKSLSSVIGDETVTAYMKKALKASKDPVKALKYPPALSLYNPSRYLGATSEKFAKAVQNYVKSNPDSLLKSKNSEVTKWLRQRHEPISSHLFKALMNVRYMRSLVDPGEAVGLLASQGIGEPSTQMTLNTFHFAGHGAANVTLGIPRLREIVMTASTKPKTPSMTLPVLANVDLGIVEGFCKRASRLSLSQVVDKVVVNERLTQSRHRMFTVSIHFYPMSECEEEYDVTASEILAAFGTEFPLVLKKNLILEMKRLQADIRTQMADVGKGKGSDESGRDENGDDDDADPSPKVNGADDDASEIGDGDATAEKRAKQSKQQVSYESDDEDEDEGPPKAFNDEDLEAEYNTDSDSDDEMMDESSGQGPDNLANQTNTVREMFIGNLKSATSFSFAETQAKFELEFGSDLPKLLLVGIIERTCQKTVVREIPGIADCFVSKEDGKGSSVKVVTNGSNFAGLWNFARTYSEDVLDLDNIYSNDIYAGLQTYGVEMARAAILKEIKGVFGAYKIEIDGRHLELVADYMTFDGGYKPFNRKGISASSSPLLKASYETTAAFLSDATLHGDFDNLQTPSSNIVLGRPSHTGTGSFDIVQPLVVR